MRVTRTRLIPILFLLFLAAMNLQAQERGNIVEYFGRETVETIEEGNVSHLFRDGLVLPTGPTGGGVVPSRDIIAWQFATGSFVDPSDGKVVSTLGNDSLYVWRNISANGDGLFEGRQMRRSYLYTSLMANREDIVLLDARGHTRVYINGQPYEGDHYDFNYTLIPFKLKKGVNSFVYTPGRFGRVMSKLVVPRKPVMFTRRDMTLPSVLTGETADQWGAIRVINASEKDLDGLTIKCVLQSGEQASFEAGSVMALSVRKLKFIVPPTTFRQEDGKVKAELILTGRDGREIDRTEVELNQQDPNRHHERTFVSRVDGSVQYYSVAPSTNPGPDQALVLSVHGAGVEARNQARAYKQKDWLHLVAATNRRPYGFNWEEWGRIDGMEVLAEAKKVFKTKPELTYLTGHSMGGHGTWHLGVTFPDQWAAIAPCASYPDILGYRRDVRSTGFEEDSHFTMLQRSSNGGRTLSLKRNFLQSGIHILHGDEDTVVPTELARMMRKELGEFHPDFVYYEYPGGSHWYGDHSVDWHPIFTYFKWHTIPQVNEVNHLEFHTASPGISASNYWITIQQQEKPLEFSNVVFDRKNDTITGTLENVAMVTFHFSKLQPVGNPVVMIGDQTIRAEGRQDLTIKKVNGKWEVATLNTDEKYPARNGGIKSAFDNRVVLVYATGGSREENEWYRNRARFDGEAFLYKANGSFEIVSDQQFDPEKYKDRNVVLYGNADINKAWNLVLKDCPVKVQRNVIQFGNKTFTGDDLGTFFSYPRAGSGVATVGVVAGTGIRGMKAAYANDYFSGVSGLPDLLIFNTDYLKEGFDGILASGFFNNDWTIGEHMVTD